LYLKASSLYRVEAPNDEIKSLLIESKQHYEEVIVQCARGSVSAKSVTSMKLQTFGGILLGQMYLDESNWQKAEEELSEAILASQGTGLKSQRFYQAYLQLGMASYYQQKWCLAAKSWEKAKELARAYEVTFPDQLSETLKYAKSQI
jgi:tetratricopeptide (TPR) repeat protein